MYLHPRGDVWLIRGKVRLCACACFSPIFSHVSSARCSDSPLIPFSSRTKHLGYIIIIFSCSCFVKRYAQQRASFWAPVLREVPPNDTKITSFQGTFELKYICFLLLLLLSDAHCCVSVAWSNCMPSFGIINIFFLSKGSIQTALYPRKG